MAFEVLTWDLSTRLCSVSLSILIHIFSIVIFLDWDDTLFPSSYLASNGYRLDSTSINSDILKELKEVEHWVGQLLELLTTKADVYIVTNAETGWVELSAAKFIPALAAKVGAMEVVSARTKYETLFPESPFKWKVCIFNINNHQLSSS